MQSLTVRVNALTPANVLQSSGDIFGTDAVKRYMLAPRADSYGNFMRLSSRHDEHHIIGRFFESFE